MRSCKNEGWGSREVGITVDTLGMVSERPFERRQTILRMIPLALNLKRTETVSADKVPDRRTKAESFTGLFRWLVKRFPLLYAVKGDISYWSKSDFLEETIDNLKSITSGSAPSNISHIGSEGDTAASTAAIRKLLNMFVSDFPEQAAELVKVGQSGAADRENAKVHDLCSLVEEFESSESLFKALDAATVLATDIDQSSNTVLHRATKYGTLPGPVTDVTGRTDRGTRQTCKRGQEQDLGGARLDWDWTRRYFVSRNIRQDRNRSKGRNV